MSDIPVGGTLAAAGSFPIVRDSGVEGGFHIVADQTARNAIPVLLRKARMIVIQQDTGVWYQLKNSPWVSTDSDWQKPIGLGTSFVFNQSAGIDSGNQFSTWAPLWAAVQQAQGIVTILFAGGSGHFIPAGTYDCAGAVDLEGARLYQISNGANYASVSFANGAFFLNPRTIRNLTLIIGTTSPILQGASGAVTAHTSLENVNISCISSQALINTSAVLFSKGRVSVRGNLTFDGPASLWIFDSLSSNNPITAELYLAEGVIVPSNRVSGGVVSPASTFTVFVDAGASFSTTQTGLLGTLTITKYQTPLTVLSSGSQIGLRPALNFSGGVTVTDDSGNNRVNVVVSTGSSITVQEEGVDAGTRSKVNFIGAAVTAVDNPGQSRVDVTVTSGTASIDVQEEGTTVSTRAKVNFIGASVTAVDNPGQTRADVTVIPIIDVKQGGTLIGSRPKLNFSGNVSVADNVGSNQVDVAIPLLAIKDEGTLAGSRQTLNFTGAAVTATDDVGNNRVNIDVPGTLVEENASAIGTRATLNFTGGVTVTDDPGNSRVNIAITTPSGSLAFQDEGSAVSSRGIVNFVGNGVVATDDVGNTRVNVTVPGTTVKDEGTSLTFRQAINFLGAGVVAADNGGTGQTDVTVAGIAVKDEGTSLTTNPAAIDFTGSGVTASFSSGTVTVNVPTPTLQIQDEGTAVGTRPAINFIGPGVTAVDNPGSSRVDVTVPSIEIKDEGVSLTTHPVVIDFTGAGVTASYSTGVVTVDVPSTSGLQIEDEGSVVATEPSINFIGAAVTAVDNPGSSRVDITIPGIAIKDEGTSLTSQPTAIDFTGAGVTASFSAGTVTVNVPASTLAVQEEGSVVGTRPAINFIGPGVTALDNPGSSRVDVTVAGIEIKDEGSSLTTQPVVIDFTGAGVTASFASGTVTVDVPASSLQIEDEGSVVATRPTLNFIGPGVTAVDNPGSSRVDVTISSTSSIDVQEEGVVVGTQNAINFIGAEVTAVDNPGASRVDITVASVTALAVQEEGSLVGTRGILNFIGDSVVAVDNPGSSRVDVTVSASTAVIKDGTFIATRPFLQFNGSNIAVVDNPGNNAVYVSVLPLVEVAEAGTLIGTEPRINFIGAGVSVVDNPGSSRVDVTLSSAIDIQEEGTTVGTRGILNFIGADITAVDNPGSSRVDVTVSSPTLLAVQDEASLVGTRGTINFIGLGVTAVDNPGSTRVDVTIPGGTGSPGDDGSALRALEHGKLGKYVAKESTGFVFGKDSFAGIVEIDGVVIAVARASNTSNNWSVYNRDTVLNTETLVTTISASPGEQLRDIVTYKAGANPLPTLVFVFDTSAQVFDVAIVYALGVASVTLFSTFFVSPYTSFLRAAVMEVGDAGPGTPGYLYVVGDPNIVVMNLASGSFGNAFVGRTATAIAVVDYSTVYAGTSAGDVYRYTRSGGGLTSETLVFSASGSAVVDLCFDGKHLWVAVDSGLNTYAAYDLVSYLPVFQRNFIQHATTRFAFDGKTVYASTSDTFGQPFLVRLSVYDKTVSSFNLDTLQGYAKGVVVDREGTLTVGYEIPGVPGPLATGLSSSPRIFAGVQEAETFSTYLGSLVKTTSDSEIYGTITLGFDGTIRRVFLRVVVNVVGGGDPTSYDFNTRINGSIINTHTEVFLTAGTYLVDFDPATDFVSGNVFDIEILATGAPATVTADWNFELVYGWHRNVVAFNGLPVTALPATLTPGGPLSNSASWLETVKTSINIVTSLPGHTYQIDIRKNGSSVASQSFSDVGVGPYDFDIAVGTLFLPADVLDYYIDGVSDPGETVDWLVDFNNIYFNTTQVFRKTDSPPSFTDTDTVTDVEIDYTVLQACTSTSLIAELVINGTIVDSHAFTEAAPGAGVESYSITPVVVAAGQFYYLRIKNASPADAPSLTWDTGIGTNQLSLTLAAHPRAYLASYPRLARDDGHVGRFDRLVVPTLNPQGGGGFPLPLRVVEGGVVRSDFAYVNPDVAVYSVSGSNRVNERNTLAGALAVLADSRGNAVLEFKTVGMGLPNITALPCNNYIELKGTQLFGVGANFLNLVGVAGGAISKPRALSFLEIWLDGSSTDIGIRIGSAVPGIRDFYIDSCLLNNTATTFALVSVTEAFPTAVHLLGNTALYSTPGGGASILKLDRAQPLNLYVGPFCEIQNSTLDVTAGSVLNVYLAPGAKYNAAASTGGAGTINVFALENRVRNVSSSVSIESWDRSIRADSTGGALTLTLVTAPYDGQRHTFKDVGNNASVNNITVDGNGINIDGAGTYVMATNRSAVTIEYALAANTWDVLAAV